MCDFQKSRWVHGPQNGYSSKSEQDHKLIFDIHMLPTIKNYSQDKIRNRCRTSNTTLSPHKLYDNFLLLFYDSSMVGCTSCPLISCCKSHVTGVLVIQSNLLSVKLTVTYQVLKKIVFTKKQTTKPSLDMKMGWTLLSEIEMLLFWSDNFLCPKGFYPNLSMKLSWHPIQYLAKGALYYHSLKPKGK